MVVFISLPFSSSPFPWNSSSPFSSLIEFYQHILFRHPSRKGPPEGSELNENPILIILVPQACPLGASVHLTIISWNSTVQWNKHYIRTQKTSATSKCCGFNKLFFNAEPHLSHYKMELVIFTLPTSKGCMKVKFSGAFKESILRIRNYFDVAMSSRMRTW